MAEKSDEDLSTGHDAAQSSLSLVRPQQNERYEPEEQLTPVSKPHESKAWHGSAVQDDGSNFTEEELVTKLIREKIVNGDSDISELDHLPKGCEKDILCAVGKNGRNILLDCAFHRNISALQKVLDVLEQLALDNLLHKSADNEDNNILQIAFMSDDRNFIHEVWRIVNKLDEEVVANLATHLNVFGANAFSIALDNKNSTIVLIIPHLPALELSESDITDLIHRDINNVNAIEKAVATGNIDYAIELVRMIMRNTSAALHGLRRLYLGRAERQNPDNNDTGTDNDGEVQQEIDVPFVEKLMVTRNDTNCYQIDQLLKLFIVEVFSITYNVTEATNHFHALTLPLYNGVACLLSTFITNKCYDIIEALLKTNGFRNRFWGQLEEPAGPFNREKLEGHAMDSRLVALFNAPPSKSYLNLSNIEQAKPQAIFAYTEKHTANSKLSNRSGATEECYELKEAFQNKLRYNCNIFSGEQRRWRKWQFIEWFGERLEEIKGNTSTLFIAVFAHGEEGIIFDSDKEPIAISEIVKLANEHMCTGIPITLFVQACRNIPAIGEPPSLGLKRHNILLRSCAEGEGSIRSVYANKMADCINNGSGLLDVIETHHTVADHIAEHRDTNIQQQTPQISHLGKRKIPLGNCS